MKLIVSVQGKSEITNTEMIRDCINAGAWMIRTDKPVHCRVPIIGLKKVKVQNRAKIPYITPTLNEVKFVSKWAQYVAVDCRIENSQNLDEIFSYCAHNNIKIVADIGKIEDYNHIVSNKFEPVYITTALGVFDTIGMPPYRLIDKLINFGCENIIAEGNINSRNRRDNILRKGIDIICIGNAISNPYKLTRHYICDIMQKGVING